MIAVAAMDVLSAMETDPADAVAATNAVTAVFVGVWLFGIAQDSDDGLLLLLLLHNLELSLRVQLEARDQSNNRRALTDETHPAHGA